MPASGSREARLKCPTPPRLTSAASAEPRSRLRDTRTLLLTVIALALAPYAARAAENPPTITSHAFADHHINIGWSGPDHYNGFNIRYALGSFSNVQVTQVHVDGGTGGSFSVLPPNPGSYVFIVEGCNADSLGIFHSDCSKWSAQVAVTAPTEPPPQTTSLTWGHMSSGDCEMQDAKVTFSSYGAGTFTSQVKTNHTHSGDVWHATITAENASGQGLASLPTFDSVRMDDNHPWYNWTVNFQYNAASFPQITKANISNKC